MELRVILKSVYGRPAIYPANDAAAALAEIAGTTTLAPRVLALAKARLGATVITLENDAAAVSAMLKGAGVAA